MCRLGHTVVSSPEVVVRTRLQQQIGGYLPSLPHTADVEMWMRFAAHSGVAFIKGVDQAYYRIHGTQMTTERVPDRRSAPAQGRVRRALRRPRRPHPRRRPAATAGQPQDGQGGPVARVPRLRPAPDGETPVTELVGVRPRRPTPRRARLPEYWGLQWRRRVGPRRVPVAATHHAVGRASPAPQHAVVAALGARGDLSAPAPLVLVGSGGFGRETAEVVRAINAAHAARTGRERWALLGFLDDDRELWGTEVSGTRVLGAIDTIAERPDAQLVVCTGHPGQLRLQAADRRAPPAPARALRDARASRRRRPRLVRAGPGHRRPGRRRHDRRRRAWAPMSASCRRSS